jgi:hypothetical protein
MTADPFQEEHRVLYDLHARLVEHLRGCRGRLAPVGETSYAQHYEFAESASGLSTYLDAAVRLAEATLYPAALSVLRSALEHQALDTLYFLANRFIHTETDVSDDALANLQAKLARGELPADVLSIERLGETKVVVTRTGIHFTSQGRGSDAPHPLPAVRSAGAI